MLHITIWIPIGQAFKMVDWNTNPNKHAKPSKFKAQTKEATVCSNETTEMHFVV
jgi:hypothetical protein